MWGDLITHDLLTTGSLNNFPVEVVNRLSPTFYDRAMDFFNDVVRLYTSEEGRAVAPRRLVEQLDSALSTHAAVRPSLPSLDDLADLYGERSQVLSMDLRNWRLYPSCPDTY